MIRTGAEIRKAILDYSSELHFDYDESGAYDIAEKTVLVSCNDQELVSYNTYMARICKLI